MSTGKERYQLLPWNNNAIAIRNSFYNKRRCKRQQCGISPSCLDAGCLFTQQRATWEGVLSAVSETLWLDLEERPFQDKHSWCCGTGTRDWEKGGKKNKKAKMTSQHLPNLWLEAVGAIIHPEAQEEPRLRCESPAAVLDRAGNAWQWDGTVGEVLSPSLPLSCSSSAITACPCPSENTAWPIIPIITWKMFFSGCIKALFPYLCLFFCAPLPSLALWSDQGCLAVQPLPVINVLTQQLFTSGWVFVLLWSLSMTSLSPHLSSFSPRCPHPTSSLPTLSISPQKCQWAQNETQEGPEIPP